MGILLIMPDFSYNIGENNGSSDGFYDWLKIEDINFSSTDGKYVTVKKIDFCAISYFMKLAFSK